MQTQIQATSKKTLDDCLGTVVLQPQSLAGNEGAAFYDALEEAIAAKQVIIIDLLWMEQLEPDRLIPLANAFLKAQAQGKPLTFLSMEQSARMQFERLIQQRSRLDQMSSYGIFAPEFEAFLEQHRQLQSSAALY